MEKEKDKCWMCKKELQSNELHYCNDCINKVYERCKDCRFACSNLCIYHNVDSKMYIKECKAKKSREEKLHISKYYINDEIHLVFEENKIYLSREKEDRNEERWYIDEFALSNLKKIAKYGFFYESHKKSMKVNKICDDCTKCQNKSNTYGYCKQFDITVSLKERCYSVFKRMENKSCSDCCDCDCSCCSCELILSICCNIFGWSLVNEFKYSTCKSSICCVSCCIFFPNNFLDLDDDCCDDLLVADC